MIKNFENYKIIQSNHNNMDEVEKNLVNLLYEKFPESYYTIFITKWNDGDFRVELRHAELPDGNKIHHWIWYNKEIEYFFEIIDENWDVIERSKPIIIKN